MNLRTFEREMTPFHVFSLDDIRKKEPGFDTRRLVEWQDKAAVQRIVNRWYRLAEQPLTEEELFLIANSIYAPSYISLESALNFYGLIPEGVFAITSVSTRKTQDFQTPVGHFFYRSHAPSLHFGYSLAQVGNRHFKIATPEKAVLDYLYFHREMNSFDDFEAWRIDADSLKTMLDPEKTKAFLALFGNKSLEKRMSKLLKYINQHD